MKREQGVWLGLREKGIRSQSTMVREEKEGEELDCIAHLRKGLFQGLTRCLASRRGGEDQILGSADRLDQEEKLICHQPVCSGKKRGK